MADRKIDRELQEQEVIRKNLAQLVDKMYSEFSSSNNFEHGRYDYRSARIHDYCCANTSDAVAYNYSGSRFKLTCRGPHFRDTSESWDFAGLSVYDGNISLDLEKYVSYFAGYSTHGSVPYPIKILSMKHLEKRKYEVVAQVASSQITFSVDFETRKVNEGGKKDGKNN